MQKTKCEITEVAPFPPAIRVDDESYAELALCHAREFYKAMPDAPRTVAEAMDQYHVEVWAERERIVGTEGAGVTETTEQAAALEISDLAVIDIRHSGDHCGILYHSADVNPEDPSDRNHRLLLVRWDAKAEVHRMADVTKGFRIETFDEYNESVADRRELNKDGSYSAPQGSVRYSAPAKNLMKGCHIVFGGQVRFVVDCKNVPGIEKYGLPDIDYPVIISFANGHEICVPGYLEVTHVEHTG